MPSIKIAVPEAVRPKSDKASKRKSIRIPAREQARPERTDRISGLLKTLSKTEDSLFFGVTNSNRVSVVAIPKLPNKAAVTTARSRPYSP